MRWFHNRYPHSVNIFDVKSIVGKIRPQIKNCWDSNRSEFLHEFDALRYAGYLLRWKNRRPCGGRSFAFTFKRYGHFWSRRRSAFVHKLKTVWICNGNGSLTADFAFVKEQKCAAKYFPAFRSMYPDLKMRTEYHFLGHLVHHYGKNDDFKKLKSSNDLEILLIWQLDCILISV